MRTICAASTPVNPDEPSKAPDSVRFRAPRAEDARRLWSLARDSGALELNSPYAYLLVCTHFASTSLVAEADERIVGFVAGYRLPERPGVFFVWQIGVDGSCRGKRIGSRLLHAALQRPGCRGARFLEATVTPSNRASRALFRSLARDLSTSCREDPCFPAHLFPGEGHEEEVLFRIGPIHTASPATGMEGDR